MLVNRRRWQSAERSVATLAQGKTQPASGAAWHSKGDVKSADALIQVKSTMKKSFKLRLDDLHTIAKQAVAADRQPRLIVQFATPSGIERYVVQPYYGEE